MINSQLIHKWSVINVLRAITLGFLAISAVLTFSPVKAMAQSSPVYSQLIFYVPYDTNSEFWPLDRPLSLDDVVSDNDYDYHNNEGASVNIEIKALQNFQGSQKPNKSFFNCDTTPDRGNKPFDYFVGYYAKKYGLTEEIFRKPPWVANFFRDRYSSEEEPRYLGNQGLGICIWNNVPSSTSFSYATPPLKIFATYTSQNTYKRTTVLDCPRVMIPTDPRFKKPAPNTFNNTCKTGNLLHKYLVLDYDKEAKQWLSVNPGDEKIAAKLNSQKITPEQVVPQVNGVAHAQELNPTAPATDGSLSDTTNLSASTPPWYCTYFRVGCPDPNPPPDQSCYFMEVAPKEDFSATIKPPQSDNLPSKDYQITSLCGELTWEVYAPDGWITVEPNQGRSSAFQPAAVKVSINENANALSLGEHIARVRFLNAANGAGNTDITVKLTVQRDPKPACSDDLDNDHDLLIDYPTDPGCQSAEDDNETDESSSGESGAGGGSAGGTSGGSGDTGNGSGANGSGATGESLLSLYKIPKPVATAKSPNRIRYIWVLMELGNGRTFQGKISPNQLKDELRYHLTAVSRRNRWDVGKIEPFLKVLSGTLIDPYTRVAEGHTNPNYFEISHSAERTNFINKNYYIWSGFFGDRNLAKETLLWEKNSMKLVIGTTVTAQELEIDEKIANEHTNRVYEMYQLKEGVIDILHDPQMWNTIKLSPIASQFEAVAAKYMAMWFKPQAGLALAHAEKAVESVGTAYKKVIPKIGYGSQALAKKVSVSIPDILSRLHQTEFNVGFDTIKGWQINTVGLKFSPKHHLNFDGQTFAETTKTLLSGLDDSHKFIELWNDVADLGYNTADDYMRYFKDYDVTIFHQTANYNVGSVELKRINAESIRSRIRFNYYRINDPISFPQHTIAKRSIGFEEGLHQYYTHRRMPVKIGESVMKEADRKYQMPEWLEEGAQGIFNELWYGKGYGRKAIEYNQPTRRFGESVTKHLAKQAYECGSPGEIMLVKAMFNNSKTEWGLKYISDFFDQKMLERNPGYESNVIPGAGNIKNSALFFINDITDKQLKLIEKREQYRKLLRSSANLKLETLWRLLPDKDSQEAVKLRFSDLRSNISTDEFKKYYRNYLKRVETEIYQNNLKLFGGKIKSVANGKTSYSQVKGLFHYLCNPGL